MTTVCVSTPDLAAAITAAHPELEVLVWSDQHSPPDGLDRVEFWVPEFLASGADFAKLGALQVVQLASAGAETFVEVVPEGVTLCDGRGVHGGSTSEWAMTALLAVLRDIPVFVRAAERGIWDRHTTDELQDKRVLVLGAGDLGEQMKRRLEAFDATVTMVARRARDGVHATDELPTLLPAADVVVVMVPLTPATTGMVDARFLASMPDGAVLVNAARGKVVDTDALLAELSAGRLRAALDVTDPEPLPAGHPLWDLHNALVTPHVGGNVVGFPGRAEKLVLAQLGRWLAGEPLENVVSEGY
ncbi:2-hydroxyacid dehydrogenase [Jatrophihabitans sp. YIM 134969]